MADESDSLPARELYASAIAIVGGGYVLVRGAQWMQARTPLQMGVGGSLSNFLLVVLGAVILIHGVMLLSDFRERFEGKNPMLMIGYGSLLLLVELLKEAISTPGTASMVEADPGIVPLAILLILSGIIIQFKT